MRGAEWQPLDVLVAHQTTFGADDGPFKYSGVRSRRSRGALEFTGALDWPAAGLFVVETAAGTPPERRRRRRDRADTTRQRDDEHRRARRALRRRLRGRWRCRGACRAAGERLGALDGAARAQKKLARAAPARVAAPAKYSGELEASLRRVSGWFGDVGLVNVSVGGLIGARIGVGGGLVVRVGARAPGGDLFGLV